MLAALTRLLRASPFGATPTAAVGIAATRWSAPVRTNFQPARTKYRKQFKGRVRGFAHNGNTIEFGEFGLQALDPVRITSNQLEAARRAITRKVKKVGQMWVRVFPDVPVSRKPAEVRMGKGKGAVDHYICRVKANKILFEMGGVPKELAQDALRLASDKLPVRTRFLDKSDPVYHTWLASLAASNQTPEPPPPPPSAAASSSTSA